MGCSVGLVDVDPESGGPEVGPASFLVVKERDHAHAHLGGPGEAPGAKVASWGQCCLCPRS